MDEQAIINAAVTGFTDEARGVEYRLDPESATWQSRTIPGSGDIEIEEVGRENERRVYGLTTNEAAAPRRRCQEGMSFELVGNSRGGPYRDEEVDYAQAADLLPLPHMTY